MLEPYRSNEKPWGYTGIMINRQSAAPEQEENLLGNFLKDRRTKLDAARFGYASTRRRTPGLRREEVAQRAGVSTTWYTWLEQGRGGAPSADVLERLADALALSEVEREHLFLLAQNRPPEVRHHDVEAVSPQLQRILDAMEYSAAYIKTAEWDIVAWNRAATVVFRDLMALPDDQRNLLRVVFDPRARAGDTPLGKRRTIRSSDIPNRNCENRGLRARQGADR